MELKEYRRLYEIEDRQWWLVSKRRLLSKFLDGSYGHEGRLNILDAGCGMGANLQFFERYGSIFGIDISDEALNFCLQRGIGKVAMASVNELPFRAETFDLLLSIDVLSHILVDDRKALLELHRVCRNDGQVLICLPAYPFLRSEFDEAYHIRQRYRKADLLGKLKGAGFLVERVTYINAIFFPLIVILRLLKRYAFRIKKLRNREVRPESGMDIPPQFLNVLLQQIMRIEEAWLNIGNLPFGIKILCLARKRRYGYK